MPELVPARVAAEHRGGYEVWSERTSGLAQLSGKLRHAQAAAAIGDWVGLRAAPGPDDVAVIEHVFERRTAFTRGAAGRETRAQVVAANVDQVFVVCGLERLPLQPSTHKDNEGYLKTKKDRFGHWLYF